MKDIHNKILTEFRKRINSNKLNESMGGYIAGLLADLSGAVDELKTYDKVTDNDIRKLQKSLTVFEKTWRQTLKNKGLIGF